MINEPRWHILSEGRSIAVYAFISYSTRKLYVGSSQRLRCRYFEHLRLLRCSRHHNRHLQHTFDKYGESDLCFVVLAFGTNSTVLLLEQFYLDTLPKNLLMNHAVDAKAPMKGKTLTAEHRAKLSANSKLYADKARELMYKVVENNRGRKFTESHKRALSAALTGRKLPAEVVKKISQSNKGKHRESPTEETKKKISKSLTGCKRGSYSNETKLKMSIGQKKAWLRRKGLC